MRILAGLESLESPPPGAVVTIGNFDGVHRGHSRIFSQVVREARRIGGTPVLITFKPHPTKILRPENAPPMISTREQRYRMFAEAGIEIVIAIPFTLELSRTSAESFLCDLVIPRVAPRKIIIGTPFRFGHRRSGDVALLKELGRQRGFEAEGIGEVDSDGATISSTRIRAALLAGNVSAGARMLGHPFELLGTVVRGSGRGRRLQFPTANLEVDNELIPADGVYVTRLRHGDVLLDSVTNIGVRPTFDEKVRTVEVHALDFHEELYGERVGLQMIERLRDEQRFPSADALSRQIRADVARAREILGRHL